MEGEVVSKRMMKEVKKKDPKPGLRDWNLFVVVG
jgi:hypothetical protein